jgi:hypothetical protein
MAACPAYGCQICSLCCTLDARCDDLCKPQARLSTQWLRALQRLLPRAWWPVLPAACRPGYLLLMRGGAAAGAAVWALYLLALRSPAAWTPSAPWRWHRCCAPASSRPLRCCC